MPQIEGWMYLVGGIGAVFIFFLSVGLMMKRFYQRAAADEALVRTGSGGTKVSIGGGMIVLPVLHQIMRVSLRTITLTVERFGEQLGEDWASADEGDLPMSIILLDVSRAVTADPDVAGTAARLLAGEFSAAGTVSHAGDNQFALLLMNIALDDAIEIAGLIQTALGSVMPSAAERISVGVSERRGSREDDAASYLRSLREAMDEGVAAGQNFVVYG
ncbi:MAG: hypothetical protein HN420_15675 [Rhodospirillaceae bacterium]|nr:hypothetical protein [Rhodospirillaceae bacterium]